MAQSKSSIYPLLNGDFPYIFVCSPEGAAYLVGGFNPSEKYVFVNGKDDNPYMKWKIKAMFETTNQIYIYIYYSLDQVLITNNHY